MKINDQKTVTAWLLGQARKSPSNSTDDETLFSYDTPIAKRNNFNHILLVNARFSITTTKLQKCVREIVTRDMPKVTIKEVSSLL